MARRAHARFAATTYLRTTKQNQYREVSELQVQVGVPLHPGQPIARVASDHQWAD